MALPRLYISGPMAGYPEMNFPAFYAAERKLRAAGFEVCNPADIVLPCGCSSGTVCGRETEHEWAEYLREDLIVMLQTSDALALLPGYENSRGAQAEIDVAQKLGWTCQPIGFWLGEALLPTLEPGALLRARPESAPPAPPAVRISESVQ